jgi:RHS repeat-associated protein
MDALTYDDRHRPDVLTSGPLSLTYGYDDVGNVRTIDDARSGFDQTFDYDVVDRLAGVTGFGAGTYTYDARGNRRTKNGTTYTYHGSTDRLETDGTLSYSYDDVGNTFTAGPLTSTYTPLQMVATATVGGATTTYGYDGDNQRRLRTRANLTKDYFVPGPGLVPLAEYRKTATGARVLVREYIYAGDRLIASVGLEPAALPSVTWTDHPLVPDVTAVKDVHLTELRTAVNAARTAHGLPAASWTSATVAPGVTLIQAVHIAELRTAMGEVYTAGGATAPTYTDPIVPTLVRAVHLNELRAARTSAPVTEVMATRYYHHDALGSVRAVTDTAGATVRRHDYAAFGEEPAPAPGTDQRRFTGKERDIETGLDYFSARYYQNTTGRFTTVDPYNILSEAEDEADLIAYLSSPQRWNRYGYALNNPGKFRDPDGRNPVFALPLIGAGVFGGWRALQNVINDRPVMEGVHAAVADGLVFGGLGLIAGPLLAGAEVGGLTTAGLSGPAGAAPLGASREAFVAQLAGGRVAGDFKVTMQGVGSTAVDVFGKAGEFIGVGGPSKALNPAKFGKQLQILADSARRAGTKAQFYFDRGTPLHTIELAQKWLGRENVFIFGAQQ